MSKIIWVVAVIFMTMATATLASAEASADKGTTQTESGVVNNAAPEAIKSDKAVSERADGGKVTGKNEAGREFLIRAWGRYGPLNIPEGWSRYYRIYYPGSFLGQPSVVDSLAVRYPEDIYTIYSLGRDRGYSVLNRFDARLATHSGSLTGAYIDWAAIRG